MPKSSFFPGLSGHDGNTGAGKPRSSRSLGCACSVLLLPPWVPSPFQEFSCDTGVVPKRLPRGWRAHRAPAPFQPWYPAEMQLPFLTKSTTLCLPPKCPGLAAHLCGVPCPLKRAKRARRDGDVCGAEHGLRLSTGQLHLQ